MPKLPVLPRLLAVLLVCALTACSGSSGGGTDAGGGGGGDGGSGGGEETKGWLLDETNTGLAGVGIAKETLALYTGPSRPARGTVITERRIETGLDLSAGEITIERCWIRPTSIGRGLSVVITFDNDAGTAPAPAAVTIRDSDIDGSALAASDVGYSAAFDGNGTVERCHIHGVGSGIAIRHAGSTVPARIEGNYIHGLRGWGDPTTTGSHQDGFTIRDYTGPSAIVRNNRIDCTSTNDSGYESDTGALFIQPNSGPIDNVLVEGNLLEGRGYNIVLERNVHGYGRNIRVVDNRFNPRGFGVGYVAQEGLGYGWGEWSENYVNEPSLPDNKGVPVITGTSL